MLFVIAIIGISIFCFTLWCSVRVAKMRDLPTWRRYLPLSLLTLSVAASLLRAVDIPQIAEVAAFPLTLAAIAVSLVEVRADKNRHTLTAKQ
ncbi:hypothetical protein AB0I52_29510 [Streptomyces sp. NPDC050423]|uniref:hypothetical protein n=1 Tax=Streptomyces sp. NPDC050423 TaxID=3155402 RepID=UPI003435DE8A